MNLSIIIPTYKRREILKESIQTILNFYPNHQFEIKVVNDDKAPLDLDFRDSRIEILQNPGKNGAASARNYGVRNSSKENLLFIDDDIVVTAGHFEKHIEALEQFPSDIVTANRKERQDLIDLLQQTSFGRYKYRHDYIWHEGFKKEEINKQYSYIDGAATFSCSMKRTTFEALEGFDENFPFAGSEDYDLFERAKKIGYHLIFDENNICYHNEPYNAKMDVWMNRHYKGVASYILLCKKHPELMESSRYALYQPITKMDNLGKILFKIKANFLGTKIGRIAINGVIWLADKLGINDQIMTRCYNARFVSSVKQGFKDFNYLGHS